MKFLLAACVLGLMCGVALADGPQVSFGPGADSGPVGPGRDVCQYGFQDTMYGSGWTLGMGQQLGISCPGPMTINSVGFYVEFMVQPGTVDIVIQDNGVEVSRTPVQPVQGNNEFVVPDTPVAGTACIMLCPQGSYWSVTGEDYTAPISGFTYWSTSCECTNAFTDNDLTIWANFGGGIPAEPLTWGALQNMFR